MILGLVVVPLLFACLIVLKPNSKIGKRLREIIGGLLDNVKIETKMDSAFNLIFVGRRIFLCFVGFFLKEYSTFQIQLGIISNLIVMIYIGNQKPFMDRNLNIIENINEFIIGLLGIIYVVFSEYCPEENVQYGYGWLFLSIFTNSFVGFTAYHLWLMMRYIRLILIRYYRRIKRSLDKIL